METAAPDKDKPMDEKYRKILMSVRVALVRDMDIKKVLRHMAAAHVFEQEDADVIKTQVSREEQCEKFLDMLPTRGAKAYGSFIEALKKGARQEFLAEVVLEAENKELNAELTSERNHSADLNREARTLKSLLEEEMKKSKVTEKQLEDVKAERDQLSTKMAKLQEEVDKLRSKKTVMRVFLPHETDFQSTGIIGFLRQDDPANLVATRSSDGPGEAADALCHRNNKICGTEEKKDSWWRIDLGENNLLFITHYSLKFGRNDPSLRRWQLQGSTDGSNWTDLEPRTEKKTLEKDIFTGTWPAVEGKEEAFRYFQILQTGFNSSKKYGIFLSGVELYGLLLQESTSH